MYKDQKMIDEGTTVTVIGLGLIGGALCSTFKKKGLKVTGVSRSETIAKALDMKVMMGCMTETSCAVSAASQLSPLVDWADLDGNLLISNDLYEGMQVVDGKVTLNKLPGIGIRKIQS